MNVNVNLPDSSYIGPNIITWIQIVLATIAILMPLISMIKYIRNYKTIKKVENFKEERKKGIKRIIFLFCLGLLFFFVSYLLGEITNYVEYLEL